MKKNILYQLFNSSLSDLFNLLNNPEFKIILPKIIEISSILCNNIPTSNKLTQCFNFL